ncbi:CidB/LrgB family [Sesbania bispinosa]|nr:CidB/LrgB family [Sesbania bispinosa]
MVMGGGHGYDALGGATVNSVGEEGGCSKVCVTLTTGEEEGGFGSWRRRTIIAAAASSAANSAGANSSLTAAVVIVTGLVGANFAQAKLDKLRFCDPIARGIATASSAHGLAIAALSAMNLRLSHFVPLLML